MNYLNLLIFLWKNSMRRYLFGIDSVQLDVGVVVLEVSLTVRLLARFK